MTGIYNYIQEKLKGFYEEREIKSFIKIILKDIFDISLPDVFAGKEINLPEEKRILLKQIIFRLQQYEPLQYILGETEFYGLPFYVNKHTLIPRPETEELVEWILKDTSSHFPYRILDIGTGSGCIAISLARYLPNAIVHACDISGKALETAERNAERNKVRVICEKFDILSVSSDSFKEEFDIIVSNPPYVTKKEKRNMEKNVLEYEPHTALFVPDTDPLLFYREITNLALLKLKRNGSLFFETSSLYGKETVSMIEEKGFKEVILKKDLSGRERMIKAKIQTNI
ncbi:MAG: peptide chain release factor N(5)-glutamine methyltransferase [Candidatus Azobacteroides sp.]|nr:peptide chain release factor N(5)-glutamine methyltransferase [Candidatus Azobacteroides sp.]